jgi:hypothetical protein
MREQRVGVRPKTEAGSRLGNYNFLWFLWRLDEQAGMTQTCHG